MRRLAGLEYNPQRTPSYTDRILWKSMPPCKGRLTQEKLNAVSAVSTSDHKPVVCALRVAPSPAFVSTKAAQPMSMVRCTYHGCTYYGC